MTGFLAPGMQGNLGFPSSLSPNHLRDKEDPSHLLNLYLLDYLKKRKFTETAAKFQQEANLLDSYNLEFDTSNGFLHEWWCAFMEIFMARQNPSYSEAGNRYNETQKQKQQVMHQLKYQQQQQHQHQQQQHQQQQQQQQSQHSQPHMHMLRHPAMQNSMGLPDGIPKLDGMLKSGMGPGALGMEQRVLSSLGASGRNMLGLNQQMMDKSLAASMANAAGWSGGGPGSSLMPGSLPGSMLGGPNSLLGSGLRASDLQQLRLQQLRNNPAAAARLGLGVDAMDTSLRDLVGEVGTGLNGLTGNSGASQLLAMMRQQQQVSQQQQQQQQQAQQSSALSPNSILPPFSSPGSTAPTSLDIDQLRKTLGPMKSSPSLGGQGSAGGGQGGAGGPPAGAGSTGTSTIENSPFASGLMAGRQQLAALANGLEDPTSHQAMQRRLVMQRMYGHPNMEQRQQQQQQQQQQAQAQAQAQQQAQQQQQLQQAQQQAAQAQAQQQQQSAMNSHAHQMQQGSQAATSQAPSAAHSNPSTPQLPPLTPQTSWPSASGGQKNANTTFNGGSTSAAAAGTPTSGDNHQNSTALLPSSSGKRGGKGGKAAGETARKRKAANAQANAANTPPPQPVSSPTNPPSSSNTNANTTSNNGTLNTNHTNMLGDARTPQTAFSDLQIRSLIDSGASQLYSQSMHGLMGNVLLKDEDLNAISTIDHLLPQGFDNEFQLCGMDGDVTDDPTLVDNVLGMLGADMEGGDLTLKNPLASLKREGEQGEDSMAGDSKRRRAG